MIIYGKQVVRYVLEHHIRLVKRIFLARRVDLPQKIRKRFANAIVTVNEREAQALSRGGNHQGILLEIEPIKYTPFEAIKQGEFLVVLDGLTDVGNIGSIVRSAYALGAEGIIATGVNRLRLEAIARSSSGALFEIPFSLRANVLDVLNELAQSGHRLYGAQTDGEAIENKYFAKRRTLVLGSEGSGLSKKVVGRLDERISISMLRPFDSLNVAAAAAILIHRMGYAIR